MRLRISSLLLYAALLGVLLGGGVVYGLVTDRWVPATEETGRLDQLPLTIEDWDGSSMEADPELVPLIQAGELLLRRYVHRSSGAAVVLYMTVGRAGPIVAAHEPDSCYPGAGYQFAAPTAKRSLAAGEAEKAQEFRVATFSKTERALPTHVRVFWSWSADGNWRVPDKPRIAFAGQRRLYKVCVIRHLPRPSEPLEDDAAAAFIRVLMPEMEKVFFTAP